MISRSGPSEALPRSERLLVRSDFLKAQSKGRRLHGGLFVLLVRERDEGGPTRIGVTVSRKVGNSVVRHLVKRWVREAFRRNKAAFPQGVDIVAIAREGKVPPSFDAVKDELVGLFANASRNARGRERRDHNNGAKKPPAPVTSSSQPQGGTGAEPRTDAKHRGR